MKNEELGEMLGALVMDQTVWSQKTFGLDSVRGPMGALKHLELEAKEAQENPEDRIEYADCFLLILDAARRAGINAKELIALAQEKLAINKKRVWPTPVDDMPVMHVK